MLGYNKRINDAILHVGQACLHADVLHSELGPGEFWIVYFNFSVNKIYNCLDTIYCVCIV